MNAKLEMRIYEVLGVKFFRKLVFGLEKLIHQRDKGFNINYHIVNNKEISGLDSFIKYLFYNGSIHTRNLILVSIYAIIKLILRWEFKIYDLAILLFAIKDLYCVILQRYNLLRIRQCKEALLRRQKKRKEKNLSRYRENFQTSYDVEYANSDLILVKRIKSCIENRETIVLSENDILALKRLMLIEEEKTNSQRKENDDGGFFI